MSSHILENSSLIDNIKYEWDIRLLFALSEPLNGVPNIIRKVHWTASAILELLGETHAESIFGEISLNISELNYHNLIPYENLTSDNIISWIKADNPDIEENLKNLLLDKKIYLLKIVELPWETSQSAETEESPSETP